MKKFLNMLLPLVIIAGGVAVFAGLKATKPEAKKSPRKDVGALVEVVTVALGDHRVEVRARGSVVPARQVVLGPEIAGRVTWLNDKLVPGGRFKKGDRLLRVDGKDYALAVQQQLAAVERARTELEVEHGRRNIAKKEWELFGGDKGEPGDKGGSKLALREPQLKTAEVAVKSAESGLSRARLAASKTTIRVPFNAMVQARQVEVGQLVSPGMVLATLVGTDAYWVQVAVPIEQLSWFAIPGVNGTEGAVVEIRQSIGQDTVLRSGRVVRLLGDVDPAGRMARVLVEIEDPLERGRGRYLGAESDSPQPLPLLIGSYVEVAIAARVLSNVATLPREALRDDDKVYVVASDSTLEIRDVGVAWRREREVLIGSGLASGDRVVVSPVPAPIAGMKLRVPGDNSASSAVPSDNEAPAGGNTAPAHKAPAAAGSEAKSR